MNKKKWLISVLCLVVVIFFIEEPLAAQNRRIVPINPDIDPINGQIAFVAFSQNDIYVLDMAATTADESINLTGSFNSDDVYPQWSPDGQSIAFLSNRSGRYDLWKMDADGNNPVNLTRNIQGLVGTHFHWSPDSEAIVIGSATEPTVSEAPDRIRIVHVSDSRIQTLTPPVDGFFDLPAWSPNGEYIAFNVLTNNLLEIWLYDVDNNQYQKILSGETSYGVPAWSADSAHVFFLKLCKEIGLDVGMYSLESKDERILTVGDHQCSATANPLHWNDLTDSVVFSSISGDYSIGISQVSLNGELTVLFDELPRYYEGFDIGVNTQTIVATVYEGEDAYLLIASLDSPENSRIIQFD